MTLPASSTRTLSDDIMVFILCAIVITVAPANYVLIRVRIRYSVTTSMLAVASSRIMTLFCLRIALQMQMSYFSPTERFEPPSSIVIPRLVPDYSIPRFIKSSRPACLKIDSSF